MAIPFLAPLGAFLANPIAQQGIAYAMPSLLDWIGKKTGLTQETPDEIGDYLRQQYMQEPQYDFDPIRQEEMRRFQQEILPDIQQRLSSAGMGGQHTGAYFLEPQRAAQDLSTRLGSLQAQFQQQKEANRLGRLSGLAGLRSGQQSYNLQRAAQRQRGAQLRAALGQDIFAGLEGLRGQEEAQRAANIESVYQRLLPKMGMTVREGNVGFIPPAINALAQGQKGLAQYLSMKNAMQAPTS